MHFLAEQFMFFFFLGLIVGILWQGVQTYLRHQCRLFTPQLFFKLHIYSLWSLASNVSETFQSNRMSNSLNSWFRFTQAAGRMERGRGRQVAPARPSQESSSPLSSTPRVRDVPASPTRTISHQKTASFAAQVTLTFIPVVKPLEVLTNNIRRKRKKNHTAKQDQCVFFYRFVSDILFVTLPVSLGLESSERCGEILF